MKRLFVIIVALFVGFAYAANENVPTSKKFVDDALAQKQPKFDGLGNDKLMLYSNTTDGVVASRDIVATLGNSTSDTSVPTVGAINTGLNKKQDILNGDAGWVAENTGIAGAVVQKPVYSATNNYGNALVEVETLNNAVINAVNSELTVVPGVGWTINTADNLNLLSVPKTYNPYLPDGYTQLEYIESTRTQYIDTGIPGTDLLDVDGASMRLKLAFTDFDAPTNSTSFYANGLGDNPQIGLALRDGKGYWQNFKTGNEELILNAIYEPTVDFKTGVLSCDGFSDVVARSVTQTSNNCLLFAANKVGIATYFANQRLYSAIITGVGGTVLRKFIPARRDSDGEIGMYDTVNNTFFTNDGTGEFIAGPDVHF